MVFWSSGLLAIRSSGHQAFWSSGHLTIWSFSLLVIWSSRLLAIWSSSHLTIRSSCHPVIRPSGLLVIWSSDLLSQCLKNVLIGIFLAYLIVGYTNLKFLMSSLYLLYMFGTSTKHSHVCTLFLIIVAQSCLAQHQWWAIPICFWRWIVLTFKVCWAYNGLKSEKKRN